MAKLTYRSSYTKGLDENGKRIIRYRYLITQATKEELLMYKAFRTQDGEDYYREEMGKPVYVSSRFIGNTAVIRGYKNEETNRIGFSVEDSDVDALTGLMQEMPELTDALSKRILDIRLAGKRISDDLTIPVAEEGDKKEEKIEDKKVSNSELINEE